MAEVTALRNNALPYPVYGVPWVVEFPILDADGDGVTSAAGLDSEVSKNGDSYGDCTNEAQEIGNGMYYLILTGTEMTADIVSVVIKSSTTGAKTTFLTLYPRKLVTLKTGTSQGGDTGYITLAAAAFTGDDEFNGCLCVATIDTNVESRVLQACTAANQQCTVTPAWNVAPDADDTYVIYLPEGRQRPTVNVTAWNGAAVATPAVSGVPKVDVTHVAGSATTATLDTIAAQVSGIGTAGGAAINTDAAIDNVSGGITGVTSGTTFAGTQSAGTYASTSNVNAAYHTITGTASGNTAMDIVYQFLTGAGTAPVQATWVGYVTSANDTITVSAWRHDTGAWEAVSSIVGTAGNTVQTKNITLFSRHRGTSAAELGKVYLRLHCTGMTTPVVATDQLVVSYAVQTRGTYADGAVWINTNASNTNTQNYVDAVPENPVSTIAAAITVANSLGLKRFRVANGSLVTLGAAFDSRTMMGHGFALALGGQNISGAYIEGVEGLSGIGTCATAEAIIVDCHLNAVTIGEADFVRCHLMGTITMSQNSVPYRFHDCTGVNSAKITFTGNAQAAVISRASGVLTVAGMQAGSTLYVDSDCDLTLDNTNTGGTVYIAGNVRLTNSGTGQTIHRDGNTTNIATIVADYAKTGEATTASSQGEAETARVSLSSQIGTPEQSGAAAAASAKGEAETARASLSGEIGALPAPLTAQETRDAMKLAPTAGDPAAGSVDKHLDDVVPTDVGAALTTYGAAKASDVPTVSAIDSQLSSTHGSGVWGSSSGVGAASVTLTIIDVNGDPIAACNVWVSSDSDGTTVVAGALDTNASGQVTFLLTAGLTYYCWRAKSGMTFTNPVSFVAVED